MEMTMAVAALGALAQTTRLSIFRSLVQAGADGRLPGELGTELGIPPATLSFHLKELSRAGLALAEQRGRTIRYRADFAAMTALVGFLTENCCGGQACLPAPACCPDAG
jgi:ArsR family transcriptional regulator